MMARVAMFGAALLALLVLGWVGAPLLQHNLDALAVKRAQAERLAVWNEPADDVSAPGDEDGALDVMATVNASILWPVGDPCALLPWLADYPQLSPRPAPCPTTDLTDLWLARQAWQNGNVDDACLRWQAWDAWVEPQALLNQSVSAGDWDGVMTLLTCLEGWQIDAAHAASYVRLSTATASAYRSLGAHLAQTASSADDIDAALAAYAAADRWDPSQQQLGTSAAARLLAARGDLAAALARLQTPAADEAVAVTVRYRLWMESAALLAADPTRADAAQAAYDAARRLRPDQIAPYTGLAALYRSSRPEWSIAAVEAGLRSPAGQSAANRGTLLRLLGDLHRAAAAWEAAACAYRAALTQSTTNQDRTSLQQAINEMETRLGRPAACE